MCFGRGVREGVREHDREDTEGGARVVRLGTFILLHFAIDTHDRDILADALGSSSCCGSTLNPPHGCAARRNYRPSHKKSCH